MATKRRTPARAKLVEAQSEAPIIPISDPVVAVSSLPDGTQFEYDGERYRKRPPVGGHIGNAVFSLHLTNPEKGWIGITSVAFEPDTLVIKK